MLFLLTVSGIIYKTSKVCHSNQYLGERFLTPFFMFYTFFFTFSIFDLKNWQKSKFRLANRWHSSCLLVEIYNSQLSNKADGRGHLKLMSHKTATSFTSKWNFTNVYFDGLKNHQNFYSEWKNTYWPLDLANPCPFHFTQPSFTICVVIAWVNPREMMIKAGSHIPKYWAQYWNRMFCSDFK